jgi:hypothetical protein
MACMTPAEIAEARQAVVLKLNDFTLSRNLGEQSGECCSIQVCNLALGGEALDTCHPSMSPLVHAWVRCIQDSLPAQIRNGAPWRVLIPRLIGTAWIGNDVARFARIFDWTLKIVRPVGPHLSNSTRMSGMDCVEFDAAWGAMIDGTTVANIARARKSVEHLEASEHVLKVLDSIRTSLECPIVEAIDYLAGAIYSAEAVVAGNGDDFRVKSLLFEDDDDVARWKDYDAVGLLAALVG